ncbi:unnamed protein product [Orchesella dallaii]|uniref:Uncharacterized protein n=1 Tax=Orchesella dallaii TaxID=48710 RepID=A0ABP1QXY3_9HEXA
MIKYSGQMRQVKTSVLEPLTVAMDASYLAIIICITSALVLIAQFKDKIINEMETEPLHRFFAEVLEVEIKAEMIRYLPHSVCDLGHTSMLQCCLVPPLDWTDVHKICHLLAYCIASLKNRSRRGWTRITVEISNRLASNHHAVIQVILVMASFVAIQYFEEVLFTAGYQIDFVAIFTCVIIEYVETKIVSDAITAGDEFRKKIRGLTGRHNDVVKSVVRSWSLRIHLAYPYYPMTRDTFLGFMQSSVEFLVDALMAG